MNSIFQSRTTAHCWNASVYASEASYVYICTLLYSMLYAYLSTHFIFLSALYYKITFEIIEKYFSTDFQKLTSPEWSRA